VIDDVRRVFEYIVSHYVVRDEVRSIDREASVVPDGRAIESDKQHAIRREERHASALAGDFEDALLQAWTRFSRGGEELRLDDGHADQNAWADALIQFLVRFDLARSRTQEIEPMHYVYFISVDWDRLFDLASTQQIDLERALRRHTGDAS
jgi:hypothetical protein